MNTEAINTILALALASFVCTSVGGFATGKTAIVLMFLGTTFSGLCAWRAIVEWKL